MVRLDSLLLWVSNPSAHRPSSAWPKLPQNSANKGISMKRTWLWCLLALLSLGSASLSQAQQASGATEKAILALEDQWLQSQKTNNPDLVAPLLADKFVETSGVGKVLNKAEFLARERATKYSSVEYPDMKVTVFGDTAIATGDVRFKAPMSQGKPFDDHFRWTDTWVKMPDGKWQCVATHSLEHREVNNTQRIIELAGADRRRPLSSRNATRDTQSPCERVRGAQPSNANRRWCQPMTVECVDPYETPRDAQPIPAAEVVSPKAQIPCRPAAHDS